MTTPVAKGSYNPLKYTPAQLAKALVVLLTSVVTILGLIATSFDSGPLQSVGTWAIGAGAVLAPIAAFVTKAAPVMAMLGNPFGEGKTSS